MAVLAVDPGPSAPLFAIVFAALLCVESLLSHWRFRTGWHMTTGRLATKPALRALLVSLGYSALPSAIASGSLTGMFTIMRFRDGRLNTFAADVILLLGIGFLFCSGWAIKEFDRPSRRRTPTWLKQQGRPSGNV